MVWFKVCDGFHSHPKLCLLRETASSVDQFTAAVTVWTLMGSYCAHHLTDGAFSERRAVDVTALPRRLVTASLTLLVKVGLMVEAAKPTANGEKSDEKTSHSSGNRDLQFHNWSEYQPTRAQVEHDRAKTAARVANHRGNAGKVSSSNAVTPPVTNGVTVAVTNGANNADGNGVGNSAPDPSRTSEKQPSLDDDSEKRGKNPPNAASVRSQERTWPGALELISTFRSAGMKFFPAGDAIAELNKILDDYASQGVALPIEELHRIGTHFAKHMKSGGKPWAPYADRIREKDWSLLQSVVGIVKDCPECNPAPVSQNRPVRAPNGASVPVPTSGTPNAPRIASSAVELPPSQRPVWTPPVIAPEDMPPPGLQKRLREEIMARRNAEQAEGRAKQAALESKWAEEIKEFEAQRAGSTGGANGAR